METIGVRDLRENASRYLERVCHGETLEVSVRGRVVARLVPISSDPWAAMVESGRVLLVEDDIALADEEPGVYDVDASGLLMAMRGAER